MLKKLALIIRTFGPLRIALLLLVVSDLVFRPVPGTPVVLEGVRVMTDMIVPVFAPILFMLLLLDAIMTGIYMTAMEGEDKSRYRIILWTDLALAAFFIWYWVPYFKALNI